MRPRPLVAAAFAALLAAALPGAPAHAADGDLKGWRDLPFGTSLADAQRAHPCTATSGEGGLTACRLDQAVRIRNLGFNAVLGFDEAGLVSATLSLLPVAGDTTGQLTDQIFALLCLDGARKYGTPALQLPPSVGRDRVGGTVWKFGSGGYLSIAVEGRGPRALTLVYHGAARLPADP